MILPVSNVISVTIAPTPSGLSEKNVNSLALFTNEVPDNLDPYSINLSASQVAADYGTASVTAQMANAVFAQVPNLISGRGRLVVIPMIAAVSATHGRFVTTNISANVAGLIAVSNGNLKVTLNGVVMNLTGLNFTNCDTLADIALVLQAAIPDSIVTSSATAITITSKKVGTGSTVALAVFAGGTDLTAVGLLNTAAGTPTAGANSTGETIAAAVARTSGQVGFVGVMSTLDLEDAAITANAAALAASDNMYLEHCASTTDIAGICTTISAASETKTRMLLYTASMSDARLYKAAYAGRAFSTDFTGSNTATTMNLKSLVTIDPDPGITQTLYSNAKTAGVDIYVSYDGVPAVLSTGGNDYFDNPYSDLALKFALEVAGFNYLRETNTKVPQTEQGMNGLKAAYAGICQQFVGNGSIAPGQWTSSETFGDPQIFVNNITTQGYYIYSLPVAQQNATDRENRVAPLVQIAIKRAGAIQSGNVIVIVND